MKALIYSSLRIKSSYENCYISVLLHLSSQTNKFLMTLSADFTIDQQVWLVEIKDQSLGFPKLGSGDP